jgi:hypothetical protein
MTLRFVSLAAAGLAALLVTAGPALAISSKTRACIAASQQARKTCTRQCVEDFRSTFASCFGPGSGCAATCIGEQAACQLDPSTAQTNCQKDTPLPDGGGACNVRLRAALEDCNDDVDPAACAMGARLASIECNAKCQLAFAEILQTCSVNFRDCLQSCASQR